MGRDPVPPRTEDTHHRSSGLSQTADKPTTETHCSDRKRLELTPSSTSGAATAKVTTRPLYIFMVKNGHFKTVLQTRFRVSF